MATMIFHGRASADERAHDGFHRQWLIGIQSEKGASPRRGEEDLGEMRGRHLSRLPLLFPYRLPT